MHCNRTIIRETAFLGHVTNSDFSILNKVIYNDCLTAHNTQAETMCDKSVLTLFIIIIIIHVQCTLNRETVVNQLFGMIRIIRRKKQSRELSCCCLLCVCITKTMIVPIRNNNYGFTLTILWFLLFTQDIRCCSNSVFKSVSESHKNEHVNKHDTGTQKEFVCL